MIDDTFLAGMNAWQTPPAGGPLCPLREGAPLATALLAAAPGHSGEAAALPLGNAPRASTQLRAQGRARREQRRC